MFVSLPFASMISISPPCGHAMSSLGINQNAGQAPIPVGTLKQKVILDGYVNCFKSRVFILADV